MKNQINKSRLEAHNLMRYMHSEINWYSNCVHHYDHNPMNNNLDNLIIVNRKTQEEIMAITGNGAYVNQELEKGGSPKKIPMITTGIVNQNDVETSDKQYWEDKLNFDNGIITTEMKQRGWG